MASIAENRKPPTWKHTGSQQEVPLPGTSLAQLSASAAGTSWSQTLSHSLLAFPPPCSNLCPHSSPFSLLHLLSSSSHCPSSFPASPLYASPADACHLPPFRASATTGCVWYPAPGLGPLPGVPRWYSTPRRVELTYGSLMGALATCVRWSLWRILAWVSQGPWEQQQLRN